MDGVGRISFLLDGVSERCLSERVATIRCFLEQVIPLASYANVDGFSDIADLPDDVSQALRRLRKHSPAIRRRWRHPEQTYMAIPVDLRAPSHLDAFLLFAPYAIHAVLAYGDESTFVVLSDTCTSIEVRLNSKEATALKADLPNGLSLRSMS